MKYFNKCFSFQKTSDSGTILLILPQCIFTGENEITKIYFESMSDINPCMLYNRLQWLFKKNTNTISFPKNSSLYIECVVKMLLTNKVWLKHPQISIHVPCPQNLLRNFKNHNVMKIRIFITFLTLYWL